MKKIIKNNWFLISLILVFVIVLADNSRVLEKLGRFLKDNNGPNTIIFIIFLFSGIIIEAEQVKKGLQNIKGTFFTLFLIFIVSPFMAYFIQKFIPMPIGVVIGLFLVSAMPTTLSSGVVMTKLAGGNMAHSLLITITSNILSIFIIPFSLSFLLCSLNKNANVFIDKTAIIIKLSFFVLLPLFIGILLKKNIFKKIKTKTKNNLQNFNQILVLTAIFMGISQSRHIILNNIDAMFIISIVVICFHFSLIFAAFFIIKTLRIKKGEYESILFMGIQKTLPLCIILQISLFPNYGLALVFCVTHHFIHLAIDSYLSLYIKNR